jgi:Na+-translocating ferredoxin:NAD+ oxidoreductase RnfG subunit
MDPKKLLKTSIIVGALTTNSINVNAQTYLTINQAKQIMWQDIAMQKTLITLSKEQMKSISKAAKVRVRNNKINAWKTATGGWFIIDQVIGKHENIDIAVSLYANGKVKSVEVLTYRETYGGQVRNPKWLAQFYNKDNSEYLQLDKQIKNISGATLSCRHITDGVNRLTHSWDQVLRYL